MCSFLHQVWVDFPRWHPVHCLVFAENIITLNEITVVKEAPDITSGVVLQCTTLKIITI